MRWAIGILGFALLSAGCGTTAAADSAQIDALARAVQVAVHQLEKARVDSSLEVRSPFDVPSSGALVVVGPSRAIDHQRAAAAAPALAARFQARTDWPGEHFIGIVSADHTAALDLQRLGISRQLQLFLPPGRRELTLTLRSLRGEIYVAQLSAR